MRNPAPAGSWRAGFLPRGRALCGALTRVRNDGGDSTCARTFYRSRRLLTNGRCACRLGLVLTTLPFLMSVTKPSPPPQRRPAAPRRPSRVRIAAVWLALLLGSFLFGMLIISPLLGAILSSREEKPIRTPARQQRAPMPSSATPRTSSEVRRELTVEENAPRTPRPEPGINLGAEDSSRVHASDDPPVPGNAGAAAPAPISPVPGASPPSPGSGELSVEDRPAAAPPSGVTPSADPPTGEIPP